MTINGSKYSKEYLNSITQVFQSRIDANKDGKVTLDEAYKDINVSGLLAGLKEGSTEYIRLKVLTDKIPEAMKTYAGADGILQEEEWAEFLNGEEWGNVLDAYHSSSNFSKIEMGWIDNSEGMINDGQVTKGEVKAGIFNNLDIQNKRYYTAEIENLIDSYAGSDGAFTVEEYTALKNDPTYKDIFASAGEGTLKNRMLYFRQYLKAKTGTLSDVSAITGFLTTSKGTPVAFNIMINDPNAKTSDKKMLEEYILRAVHTSY